MTLALQILASCIALLGAWLLRRPGRLAPWAFVAWMVSNPTAMVFMAINGHWWFFAQHLAFFALAAESTWHWLVLPTLKAAEESSRAIRPN